MKTDVTSYIESVDNASRRDDCKALLKIFAEESGYQPVLHDRMIGFGMYHYRYDSGREGDFIVTGFAPRAQNITVYILAGFEEFQNELDKLGKHKTAKSCLYIKRLSDIDEKVLRRIIKKSVQIMQKRYPCRPA